MATKMLKKITVYPRPHYDQMDWELNAATQNCTTLPVVMYDEGLGDPGLYEAHPENALHTEVGQPNCNPDSRINKINVTIRMSLLPAHHLIDGLHKLVVGVLPYYLAFKDDYVALDELSTLDIEDILKLQRESTDRQGYPLWNAADCLAAGSTDVLLATNVPGLTGGQAIEGTAFDYEKYFEAKRHYTNAGKLNAVAPRIFFKTATRYKDAIFSFKVLNRRVKRMNPYAACGFIIFVVKSDANKQAYNAGQFTTQSVVAVKTQYLYNEWNDDFNMKRV